MSVFPSVVCDCCGSIRVRSKVFACLACSYDFCSDCVSRGAHQGHPMLRLCTPEDKYFHMRLQNQGRCPRVEDTFYTYERVTPMHGLDYYENRPETPPPVEGETKKVRMEDLPYDGLGCNECQCNAIKHTVFTCVICHDFDLCSECEESGVHNKHPMIRFSYTGDPLFHARRDGDNVMKNIRVK